VNKTKF